MTVTSVDLRARSKRSNLGRARLSDRIFTGWLWTTGVIALLPLVFIVGYVVSRGVHALNADFFVKTPAIVGQPGGGIVQSILGSALIVGMAILISVPLGILAAVYLSEFGKGKPAAAVRFLTDVLLSTPSIVAGVVVWTIVVIRLHAFSAFAGALALSILMWPIIARASEDILRLVPAELREAGTALGAPRWKVVLRVVLPAASAGLMNAILLAVARGLGETAPVLLTSLGSEYVNWSPDKQTDTISLRIYKYARSPVHSWNDIAWGAALFLLLVVLILSLTARFFGARARRASR